MVRKDAIVATIVTTIATLVTAAAGLSAAGAQAAVPATGLHCEASALRATIAGAQTVEPAVIGRSSGCSTASTSPSAALPAPLQGAVLTASTIVDAAVPSGDALGGVAGLQVVPTTSLINQLPTITAIPALPHPTVTIPEPLATVLTLAGQPTKLTLDLSSAVRALVPTPSTALLSADVLNGRASVACSGGTPQLLGSSEIAGVKLLGQAVSLTGPVSQALTLIDAQNIAASNLDVSKIKILTPLDGISSTLLSQVQSALGPLVAALPPISLPASVVQAKLTPNQQLRDASTLTERALRAQLSLLGQSLLDAIVGEAKVGASSDACPQPSAPSAPSAAPAPSAPAAAPVTPAGSVTQQLLQCTDRKLTLVDVLRDGSQVRLLGAANRDYVGQEVAIRLRATGQVVAHAIVGKDGSFSTTAPLPPRKYLASHRSANSVRYRAEIGKELSLPLKLQRRLVVTNMTSSNGKVTITGRVTRPLTQPASKIRVVRRVSCKKSELVGTFKPHPDGSFSITVPAPEGQSAAVYRLATSVREKPSNPRVYPTFSLPRGVALDTR